MTRDKSAESAPDFAAPDMAAFPNVLSGFGVTSGGSKPSVPSLQIGQSNLWIRPFSSRQVCATLVDGLFYLLAASGQSARVRSCIGRGRGDSDVVYYWTKLGDAAAKLGGVAQDKVFFFSRS